MENEIIFNAIDNNGNKFSVSYEPLTGHISFTTDVENGEDDEIFTVKAQEIVPFLETIISLIKINHGNEQRIEL